MIYDWPSAHAEAKFSSSTYPLKTTYDAKQHALHMTLADVSGEAELAGHSSPIPDLLALCAAQLPRGSITRTEHDQ